MLINLAVFLLEHSPVLRRVLWRWWYGRLASKFANNDWTFMNYGLFASDGDAPTLEPADEPDRLCIQLYRRVVSPADLRELRVLEVGSGRGGGASYLARYHRPEKMTGLDFSAEAVALSRKLHATVGNLDFVAGDAESLPFADASFDAVVNVESSHCYGRVEKFFAEAARVLKPGGFFLYTDFRTVADMAALESSLEAMREWKLVETEDITAAVAASLEADSQRKQALIDEFITPRFRHIFGEFAGLTGGRIHTGFRDGSLRYVRFAFRRN